MSEDCEEAPSNQARIYMRTSAANGLDGNEVEITVEGGESDDVEDIEETAKRRFEQAVEGAECDDVEAREYQ